MNFTTLAFSPPLPIAADVVRSSPPVSVLVVAVSNQTVALAADRIHVDLSAAPPMVRYDEVKAFRGPHLVTGIVGVTDAAAGSLGTAIANCAGEKTVAAALERFAAETTPWLPGIAAQWRAAVGSTDPVEQMATAVVGGIVNGRPVAFALQPTMQAGQLRWRESAPMLASGGESFINAYGVVDATLLAATTPHAQRYATGRVFGPIPQRRPDHRVPPMELLQHTFDLVAGAVSREGSIPRPPGWPAGVPVLGGQPVLRAVDA
ncbi:MULTISPECIES: hypothetical protein [unclassified Modestobacter]